ncbi:ribonuclease Z [Anaerovorax odorimutans]|uniref:ribonuclease Z n=1 Tax=Anaerovorax odorimutans TaxID=109327 RepID=UPI0004014E4D|nr:ribonuclease Z [Anaerovorax odorimutans]
MLDVCLPGTGGTIPLENRWLSCCWVEYQGKAILIDCGEGTQIALKKSNCKISHLDTLLITHYHADHIAGLPGFLLTLGNNGKTTPLTIIGPIGLKHIVSSLTVIAPILTFPLKLIELENKTDRLKIGDIIISYLPLKHSIPCFGYCITLNRKPIFNPVKANNLNIPKNFFKILHNGQSVKLEDGRIIQPKMVLDGIRNPIKICYCTDTQLVDSMKDFVCNADLFICEGMYGDENLHYKMAEKGHMIFSESALLAKDAHVKQLWLTHYSPALLEPEQYIDNIRKIFSNTYLAYDGIRTTL